MGLPAHSPPYNFFPPHHHHHHHHHHRHQLSAVSLIHFLEPFLYNEEAQPLSPTCLAAVSYSCFFAIMASFDPDRYDEEMLLSMAKECNDYAKECSLPTTFSNATNDATFSVVYKRARDLTEADKSIIMSILESNMKTHYEKTWGWKPLEKSKELFHPDSTFICLYPTVAVVSTNDASASVTVGVDASSVTSSSSSGKTTTELVGYSMFRFEWDDEEEPEHPVLYCYELQLAAELHGQRIGSKVMHILLQMASHWRLWKVILTCFKRNQQAMNFYIKQGFGIDKNSPSLWGCPDELYEILSNKPAQR